MAALPCANAAFFRHQFSERTTRRDSITCYSSTVVVRSTGRRNSLRRKILKTLKEPVVLKSPAVEPIDDLYSPLLGDGVLEFDAIEEIGEAERSEPGNEVSILKKSMELGDDGVVEFDANEGMVESEKSEPGNEFLSVENSMEGDVYSPYSNPGLRVTMWSGKNSILNYWLWLIGAFVIQTLLSLIFSGESSAQRDDEIRRNSAHDVGVTGESKSAIELAVKRMDLSYEDELEMEKKIEEIRIMAREAREMERVKAQEGSPDTADRRGVEEEVDNRLIMLRKKLENARTGISPASVAEFNGRQGIEELLGKKQRFRGRSMTKAKGFMGSDDRNATKSMSMMQSTKNSRKKVNKESGTSKGGGEDDAAKSKVINGMDVRPGPEAIKSGKFQADDVDMWKTQSREATVVPNVTEVPSGLRSRVFGVSEPAVVGASKRDFWWLNLPYVLVIHMHKGDDSEGLYTLNPLANTEDEISQMVAFEDRTEAANYCYLLHSVFEEMNDIKLDVVPLPVKELKEAVDSRAVSVFVVKKGALKLYVGQPFADAEMALRALAEQA